MHGSSVPFALALLEMSNLFLIILVTIINYFYFSNYISSCKFYHDRILAPIKCQKKEKKYLNTLFTVECIKHGFTFTKGKTLFVTLACSFLFVKVF